MTNAITTARTLWAIVTDLDTAQHSIETDHVCRCAALFGASLIGAALGLLITAIVSL